MLGRRPVLMLCAALMVLSVTMILAGTEAMRASWPPPQWPFSLSVPFVNRQIPQASMWWRFLLLWEAVWSIALICAVTSLVATARRYASVAALILFLQAVLLGIALQAPIPLNSDQYSYVGIAELVQQGYNPYNPPLRSEPVSAQLRQISTVWGKQHEGAADASRRVLTRDRYGPAWTLAIAALLFPFRNTSVEVQAHLLRVFAALGTLGCSVMLWLSLRPIAWRCASLAAFALHPLIIVQTAIDGHNDIFALFFGLAAYASVANKRFALAGILAALSIGTKLTFAPYLLPLVVYAAIMPGTGALLRLGTTLPGTLLITALPFGVVRALFQPMADARAYNPSYLFGLAESLLRRLPALQWIHADWIAQLYYAAIVILALGLAAATAFRKRINILEAAMVFLIFSAARFEPWYAVNLVPLLLIRTAWSLPLFLGVSLAAQYLQANKFTPVYEPPFFAFIALAIVTTMLTFLVTGRAFRKTMSNPYLLRA